MNEPSGARMRVSLTTLTMVEYFQDVNKQNALLFIDNNFRFVQAGFEVSAGLMGKYISSILIFFSSNGLDVVASPFVMIKAGTVHHLSGPDK
ncbi:hypothetical protein LguiA_004882 [Lonicera macranthoides]